MAVPTLREWRNGEVFNARDYVYERNVLIAEINRLEGIFTGNSDINVTSVNANSVSTSSLNTSSITIGGETFTSLADTGGTKIHYETLSNPAVDDLFIDYD